MEAAEHGGSFLCGPAGRKAKVDVTSSQDRGSSALRRGLLCHERQSNQNAPGLRPDPFFGGGAYELRQKKEKRSLRIRSVLQWPWRFTNSACRPFDPTEPSCFLNEDWSGTPGQRAERCLLFPGKVVPHPPACQNKRRIRRVVFNLLPQTPHRYINRPHITPNIPIIPYLLH